MTQSKRTARKTCFELRAALEEMQAFGLSQGQLAKLCGVKVNQVSRWCQGTADVPQYVWTILSMLAMEPVDVAWGEVAAWKVERRHVYRGSWDFKKLARRFHPDATGRDTTAEMQMINTLRPK